MTLSGEKILDQVSKELLSECASFVTWSLVGERSRGVG